MSYDPADMEYISKQIAKDLATQRYYEGYNQALKDQSNLQNLKNTLKGELSSEVLSRLYDDVRTEGGGTPVQSDFVKDALELAEQSAHSFQESFKKHVDHLIKRHKEIENGLEGFRVTTWVGDIPDTFYKEPERKKFDVSKLKRPVIEGIPAEDEQNMGFYFAQREILEAWNAGTIEELLEGWTK